MSHWEDCGIDWDAEVHERQIQDHIEKQARRPLWKDEYKDEVQRLLDEALAHLHSGYDIDEILKRMASATFLLECDEGRYDGIADGTPFGG